MLRDKKVKIKPKPTVRKVALRDKPSKGFIGIPDQQPITNVFP